MRLKGHPEVEIKDPFKVCFKVFKNTCIQWLQYRILYRILPVKYYLKKIKILDTDTCSLCNRGCETIIHKFFMCEKVLHVWNDLSIRIYIYIIEHQNVQVLILEM
jgi:hypothetical protein